MGSVSHSGTGKQEQTNFTEQKRQGNMQYPVNSFRRSANATVIVGRSNVIYRFTPLSYFPSGDGEINVEEWRALYGSQVGVGCEITRRSLLSLTRKELLPCYIPSISSHKKMIRPTRLTEQAHDSRRFHH